MRRLSPVEMAELALEALSNARTLFDDATLLRYHNRLPTAYTLVAFAADELGKHIMVAAFYGAREDSPEEWGKLWRRFRHHESKLEDALVAAWAGDLLTDEPLPDIKDFHRRRLSATYVDVDKDGSIQTPARMITAGHVDRAIAVVRGELEFCEKALRGVTPQQLASHMSALSGSGAVDSFRSAIADATPAAAMALVVALRAGLQQEDAAAFAEFVDKVLQPPDATA